MTPSRRTMVSIAGAVLLSACIPRQPLKVPMETLKDSGGSPADRILLVLLPGAYDMPADFFKYGFVDAIRQRNLAVDVVAANAHVSYYENKDVVTRLETDVIVPARALGYKRLWFAGISLGGLGSMLYTYYHPTEVEGVILIAPYLGPRSEFTAIAKAGGFSRWDPAVLSDDDRERKLLADLKRKLAQHHESPALYLAYGSEDRFAKQLNLVAAELPRERVFTQRGGHEWQTWSSLWQRVLDASVFEPRPK